MRTERVSGRQRVHWRVNECVVVVWLARLMRTPGPLVIESG